MEALLQIVSEEAEAAIDRAFDEGYKQGLLVSVPETEYWKMRAGAYQAEITRFKNERWLFAAGGLGAGFIVGSGFGFTIRLQN